MHSQLESYLSEVATHLGPMPIKQRKEELREMRAHLENAVIVSRELGQTEDEAAQGVVAQFGPAQELGKNVVTAWRRGVMLDRRSFWGAAACTVVMLVLVPFLLLSVLGVKPFEPMNSMRWATVKWILYGFQFGDPVLAGLASGLFFSKRAVVGVALGVTFYLLCCAGDVFYWVGHLDYVWRASEIMGYAIQLAIQYVVAGLVSLIVAWACSRWQQKRRRRIQA